MSTLDHERKTLQATFDDVTCMVETHRENTNQLKLLIKAFDQYLDMDTDLSEDEKSTQLKRSQQVKDTLLHGNPLAELYEKHVCLLNDFREFQSSTMSVINHYRTHANELSILVHEHWRKPLESIENPFVGYLTQ